MPFPRQLSKASGKPGQMNCLWAVCRAQRPSRAPYAVLLTVCMTQEGQPWISFVVHKIRMQIANDPSLNYEYLPVMGMKSFIQASLGLLFGKHSQVIVENRVRRRAPPLLTQTQGVDIGVCTILNLKGTWDSPAPRH